jgi:hypothetical protein
MKFSMKNEGFWKQKKTKLLENFFQLRNDRILNCILLETFTV